MSTDHADSENTREAQVQDPEGVHYRIRAVKVGMALRGDVPTVATGPVDFVVQFVIDTAIALAIKLRADRQDAWKLGVYRQGRTKVERLVHKEVLPPGDTPEEQILRLRNRIATGDTSLLNRA